MYREIAGTDERIRAIPGVRDRRVRATKVRLYIICLFFKASLATRHTATISQKKVGLPKKKSMGLSNFKGRKSRLPEFES